MISRKGVTILAIVYAVVFVLCMIGWGVMSGLSRDGAMSAITHRYVMLALVTTTCCTVAATLQLGTIRTLHALHALHAQPERSDEGYADGYADGLAAASSARGKVAQMPPRGSMRS